MARVSVLLAFCDPSLWANGVGYHESCSGRGLVNDADGEKVRALCSCPCHTTERDKCQKAAGKSVGAKEVCRPPESLNDEQRFGGDHARLFSFIDKRVLTPRGYGRLFTAFARRVEVVMEKSGKVEAFRPEEVFPAEDATADSTPSPPIMQSSADRSSGVSSKRLPCLRESVK